MGSLAALQAYWSSLPPLAALASYFLLGLAIAVAYRRARRGSHIRLQLVRAGTWVAVTFWTFVAASFLLCFLLADPVEYGAATVKAVAVLSISLAVGMATLVALAISRGVPARARNLPPGGWMPAGSPIQFRASRLVADLGFPSVRVRVVPGFPLALAEPPDTVIVSQGLLDRLSEEELKAVLLHELCHLTEADGPEKAFTGVMSRLLFLDPFLRMLDQASHREREYRADEWVAKRMGGGGALAAALAKLGGHGESRSRYGVGLRHPRVEDRLARLRA